MMSDEEDLGAESLSEAVLTGVVRAALVHELRATIALVQTELARRRAGRPGVGTAEELDAIHRELARIEHEPVLHDHPYGTKPHPPFKAARLTRSWPSSSPIAQGVRRVSELLPPRLP